MLGFEIQSLIDGLFGMMELQDIKQNEEARKEVSIEVDTFRQATQIVAYLIEEYGECVEISEDVGFYEKAVIGSGKESGVYTFKLDGKWWSVAHDSMSGWELGELMDSNTVVLDLRRMVW